MNLNRFLKKFVSGSAAALALFLAATPARADLTSLELQALSTVTPLDLINWKVGDTMSYQLSMVFGKGTMVKSVNKDEGTALWLHQDINIMGQNQTADVLINKADGKILKMIQNGKEVQIPDDKVEVISQDYADVTVPAGTFSSIHIVAKTKQVSKIEMWANPSETALDGALKQIMATTFGNMTLELTSFKRN
ncbi:MAG: hypothetical protein KGQ59_02320 [Bdellovibrionales bacterium]|nr:hypothetical protein [Bdellovibrionales bacterium]